MFTILHTESSTGWGGQEIRILRESIGIIERGHNVIIAAPVQSGIFRRAEREGINVVPAEFQKKNPFSIIKMSSMLTRLRPDIINTHSSSDSWVTTLAARLSKSSPKIIRTRHLSVPISKSFLSRLIYDILPDAVMTTGEEIRQRMITDNGFRSSRIISVPTGTDVERFNPENVKPSMRLSGFSVGMVGVLRSWKGHRYFLEAVSGIKERIPDASFYIVGDGPVSENIKKLIKELSLQESVVLLGHREDIPKIMASLDVIVHPSYAHEGVPQSILQALAMKKPVVASDIGAIKEVVIDGKTGFLIEPRKPELIAAKVIELYENRGLRERFGKEGRHIVEDNYTIGKMLDKIEDLYKEISDNK